MSKKLRQLPFTIIGLVIVGGMLFPVYWMINTSLQAVNGATQAEIFPFNPTLANYELALADQLGNLTTSLLIGLGNVVLTLAIAAPAAYALAKFRLRWVAIFMLALLIAQMIPGIVIVNSLYSMYNTFGILNSVPGLILADASASVPFAILILRAFLESVPDSLIEAARVDGAGHVRAFWSIVLPISRNALITAGLFSFLFAWGDFIFALTLTTGSTVTPVTLGIYKYLGATVQSWGPVMATTVLASIPAVVLLVVAQKWVNAGALGGALK